MKKGVLYGVSSFCCLLFFLMCVSSTSAMDQSSPSLGKTLVGITKALLDPLGIFFKKEQPPNQEYGQQFQGVEQPLPEESMAEGSSQDFLHNRQNVPPSLLVQNGQRWGGWYNPDGVKSNLLLEVYSVSKAWEPGIYVVQAKLYFDYNFGQCVGQGNIRGTFESKYRMLRLEPVQWINNPCGFSATSIEGGIADDGKSAWGQVRNGNFSLKLDEQ